MLSIFRAPVIIFGSPTWVTFELVNAADRPIYKFSMQTRSGDSITGRMQRDISGQYKFLADRGIPSFVLEAELNFNDAIEEANQRKIDGKA